MASAATASWKGAGEDYADTSGRMERELQDRLLLCTWEDHGEVQRELAALESTELTAPGTPDLHPRARNVGVRVVRPFGERKKSPRAPMVPQPRAAAEPTAKRSARRAMKPRAQLVTSEAGLHTAQVVQQFSAGRGTGPFSPRVSPAKGARRRDLRHGGHRRSKPSTTAAAAGVHREGYHRHESARSARLPAAERLAAGPPVSQTARESRASKDEVSPLTAVPVPPLGSRLPVGTGASHRSRILYLQRCFGDRPAAAVDVTASAAPVVASTSSGEAAQNKAEKRRLRQLAAESESFDQFEKALLGAVAKDWPTISKQQQTAAVDVGVTLPPIGRRNGHSDPP